MNAPKVSFCPYCKEHGIQKNIDGLRCAPYYSAYVNEEKTNCKYCNKPLIKMNLTVFEFNTILEISGESDFIDGMDKLKVDDIIEFNLKMSQFKGQISQAKQEESDDIPKCPTCGSTNIEKISATKKVIGGAMFGIFSSNIRNTMHCKNCGYKW